MAVRLFSTKEVAEVLQCDIGEATRMMVDGDLGEVAVIGGEPAVLKTRVMQAYAELRDAAQTAERERPRAGPELDKTRPRAGHDQPRDYESGSDDLDNESLVSALAVRACMASGDHSPERYAKELKRAKETFARERASRPRVGRATCSSRSLTLDEVQRFQGQRAADAAVQACLRENRPEMYHQFLREETRKLAS